MQENRELRLELTMSPRALDMLRDICGKSGVSKYDLPTMIFPDDKSFEAAASVSDNQQVRFSIEVEGKAVTLSGDLLHRDFYCRSVTEENFAGKNFTVYFVQELKEETSRVNKETKKRFDLWYNYIAELQKKASEGWLHFFCKGAEYKNGRIEIDTYDLKEDAEIKGLTVGFTDDKGLPTRGFGNAESLDHGLLSVSIFGGSHINVMKELGSGVRLIAYDGAADITCKRMKQGIDRLLAGEAVNKGLSDFIFDPRKANRTVGENVTLRGEDLLSKNMNPEQLSAVEGALNASDLYLIQGPPGTGKTTVIAEICYQNAIRGHKTLIVSQSNLAVDNAVSRVMNHPDVRVLRKGDVSRVEEEGLPFIEDNVVGTWIETVAAESKKTDTGIVEKMQQLKTARERLPDVLGEAENIRNLSNEKTEVQSRLYFCRNLLDEIKGMRKEFLELIDAAYSRGDIQYAYKARELYPDDLHIPMEMYNDLEQKFFDVKADIELILKAREELAFLNEYTELFSKQFEYIAGCVSMKIMENTAFEGIFYYADRDMVTRLYDEGEGIIASQPKGLKKLFFGRKWQQVAAIYYRRAENLMMSVQQRSVRLCGRIEEIQNNGAFKENSQAFRLCLDALGEDLDSQYYGVKAECERLYDKCSEIMKELGYSLECFKETLRDDFYGKALKNADPTVITLEQVEYTVNRYYALRMDRYKKWRQILFQWHGRLTRKNDRNYAALKKLYIDNANVIGITCIQSGTKDFDVNYPSFDTVIIDEASKSTPPDIILPMLKGKKIVLVGDHKQLPPFIDSTAYDETEEADDNLKALIKVSLFEEMYDKSDRSMRTMLFRQYRMHRDIAALINQFYIDTDAGRLESPASEFKQHKCGGAGLGDEEHVVWYDIPNIEANYEEKRGRSYCNLYEAQCIKKVLAMLENNLALNGGSKTVGVITFYDAQVKLLERELMSGGFAGKLSHLTLRIGSVDRFQGMEEDIIIVSFVRNNNRHDIGFARDGRRINVALSRAKDLLVIVGCSRNFIESSHAEAGVMFRNIYTIVSRLGGLRVPTDIPYIKLPEGGALREAAEMPKGRGSSEPDGEQYDSDELNILDEFILRSAYEFRDSKLTEKGVANVLGLAPVFVAGRVRHLSAAGLLQSHSGIVKITAQGEAQAQAMFG